QLAHTRVARHTYEIHRSLARYMKTTPSAMVPLLLVTHERNKGRENDLGKEPPLHLFADKFSIDLVFLLPVVRLHLRQSRVQDVQCIQFGDPPVELIDGPVKHQAEHIAI
ncbi:unnamed protein product, partial [Mycena citricolor]